MKQSLNEAFVNYLYEMIHTKKNSAFAAKMKKAENEATEAQSWEILTQWVDLENRQRTKCFALIGSAVARSKRPVNGELGLGRSLFMTIKDKSDFEKSSAAARLRRILACQDSTELVRILRSTLHFLESKDISLDYVRLLKELLYFDFDDARERSRSRWAMEFFGQKEE